MTILRADHTGESDMKKEYEAPVVQPLGSTAEQTKGGVGISGDGVRSQQNGNGPGGLDQPQQS